jgi:hypothetical protein
VRFRSRVLLPLVLALAAAGPALAAREWYDYYLQARDRDIPDKKWADCARNLREALRLRPGAATNLQTYGLQFVDYLPHYYLGVCHQGLQEHQAAIDAFNRSEQLGAIKKTPLHADLIRRRGEAQAQLDAIAARRARGEMQRLLREAQDLGRKGDWDQSLPLLAQAEVLAKGLDPETLRAVTREQERQRGAQAEATDTAARARRLEQRLADGERLLEGGKATEAKVAFDDALLLEPRNARGLEGRRVAEERIQASTTRAARRKALADGRAFFDAGQYEPALGPLTDACSAPGSAEGA